jgi:hypothetical protein
LYPAERNTLDRTGMRFMEGSHPTMAFLMA